MLFASSSQHAPVPIRFNIKPYSTAYRFIRCFNKVSLWYQCKSGYFSTVLQITNLYFIHETLWWVFDTDTKTAWSLWMKQRAGTIRPTPGRNFSFSGHKLKSESVAWAGLLDVSLFHTSETTATGSLLKNKIFMEIYLINIMKWTIYYVYWYIYTI